MLVVPFIRCFQLSSDSWHLPGLKIWMMLVMVLSMQIQMCSYWHIVSLIFLIRPCRGDENKKVFHIFCLFPRSDKLSPSAMFSQCPQSLFSAQTRWSPEDGWFRRRWGQTSFSGAQLCVYEEWAAQMFTSTLQSSTWTFRHEVRHWSHGLNSTLHSSIFNLQWQDCCLTEAQDWKWWSHNMKDDSDSIAFKYFYCRQKEVVSVWWKRMETT